MRYRILGAAAAATLLLSSTALAQCASSCTASPPDFRWQVPAGWSLLGSGAG